MVTRRMSVLRLASTAGFNPFACNPLHIKASMGFLETKRFVDGTAGSKSGLNAQLFGFSGFDGRVMVGYAAPDFIHSTTISRSLSLSGFPGGIAPWTTCCAIALASTFPGTSARPCSSAVFCDVKSNPPARWSGLWQVAHLVIIACSLDGGACTYVPAECAIKASAKVPAASPAPTTCLPAAHVTVDFIRCLIAHTNTDSASYRFTLHVAVATREEI